MKPDQLSPDQLRIVNEELFTALPAPNYAERIDLCLKKGADINARNTSGRTPLMEAVWKESPARVRYLINKGAALFLKDSSNRTAFDLNKETRDSSAKLEISQILLRAMPDATPGAKPAAAAPEPAPPAANNDITLAPPLQVKNRKKPAGGPGGGFKL